MNAREREITRRVLDIAVDLAPLPPWVPRWAAKWAAALVVGAIVVLASQIDLRALLREIAKMPGAPPEWNPEAGTGNLAPPKDMPPGGIPIPPKEWKEGEP